MLSAFLLMQGCAKPKQDLSGTYGNTEGISLTLTGDQFELKKGKETVKGETSKQGDTLYLHPKTLDDRDKDGAFLYAVDQASKMGVVTDAEVQGSVFDPVELTIGAEGKTLSVITKPKCKSGADPFYNALGTLTKS